MFIAVSGIALTWRTFSTDVSDRQSFTSDHTNVLSAHRAMVPWGSEHVARGEMNPPREPVQRLRARGIGWRVRSESDIHCDRLVGTGTAVSGLVHPDGFVRSASLGQIRI